MLVFVQYNPLYHFILVIQKTCKTYKNVKMGGA